MGRVDITIKDNEDGTLNISLEWDPPLKKGEEPTSAQVAGIEFLEYLGATPEDVTSRG